MNRKAHIHHSLGRFSSQDFSIVGMSLDNHVWRVVQTLHHRGTVEVRKMFALHVGEGPLSERAQQMKDRWHQEKIAADEIILTFPQKNAIVKNITLPATDPGEIRDMLRLQAARQTPFAIDEVMVDYRLLEKKPGGYSDVMMIIVRKEDVRTYLEPFYAAGLYPSKVILDSLTSLPLIEGKSDSSRASFALEVDSQNLKIGAFQAQRLCWVRSTSLPAIGNAAWGQALCDEIKRTLVGYSGISPDAGLLIRVAGDEKCVNEACEILRKTWGCLAQNVCPSERFKFERRFYQEMSVNYWPALAASQESLSTKSSINFLLEEEQRKKARAHFQSEWIGLAALSLLFLSVLGGSYWQQYHAKEKVLVELVRSGGIFASQTTELRRMERRMNVFKSRMSEKGSLLTLMSELNRIVPKNISIHSIDYEQGQPLTLEGNCFTLSDAVHLVETLQQSSLFSSVELRSSNVERSHDQDIVNFSLSCRLAGSSGERNHA